MKPVEARYTNNVGDTFICRVFGFVACAESDQDSDSIYAIVQLREGGPLTNVDFTDVVPLPGSGPQVAA